MPVQTNIFRQTIRAAVITAALLFLPCISGAGPIDEEKIAKEFTRRENAPYIIDVSKDLKQNFTFAIIGDSGTGSKEQYAIADKIAAVNPSFVIHLGDVVYETGEWEHYPDKFIKPYSKLLERKIEFYPIPGNHDYYDKNGDAYRKYFSRIPNRYYVIKAGQLDFFMLDAVTISKANVDQEQIDWLGASLKSSKAKFKIVLLHYPLYSSGKHGDNLVLMERLEPILKEHKIKLVLSGHEHDYERINLRGMTQVVSGGGGRKLRGMKDKARGGSLIFAEKYHYIKATYDGNSIKFEVIDKDNVTFDTFVIR